MSRLTNERFEDESYKMTKMKEQMEERRNRQTVQRRYGQKEDQRTNRRNEPRRAASVRIFYFISSIIFSFYGSPVFLCPLFLRGLLFTLLTAGGSERQFSLSREQKPLLSTLISRAKRRSAETIFMRRRFSSGVCRPPCASPGCVGKIPLK